MDFYTNAANGTLKGLIAIFKNAEKEYKTKQAKQGQQNPPRFEFPRDKIYNVAVGEMQRNLEGVNDKRAIGFLSHKLIEVIKGLLGKANAEVRNLPIGIFVASVVKVADGFTRMVDKSELEQQQNQMAPVAQNQPAQVNESVSLYSILFFL